ncbi:unnamed protein product [Prorocentrum cordatum]|uniref:Uncharacterized protein n=1 Tax=Prorocentrum cordatum TaxID=2364126 RepID=A0ABN9WZW0_9DINO|nr:unnamed protein product [Polarella glacialis]
MADMHATMAAHMRAVEHCRVASESDPDWFTLDVQDCHSRRALILRDALTALVADVAPTPEDAEAADGIRGRIYASYAHTAQNHREGGVGAPGQPGRAEAGDRGAGGGCVRALLPAHPVLAPRARGRRAHGRRGFGGRRQRGAAHLRGDRRGRSRPGACGGGPVLT